MHTIRLRGPWKFSFPDASLDTRGDSPSGTVQFPTDWAALSRQAPGPIEFSRRFNAPTGLTVNDRVHLCVSNVSGPMELIVNGHSLVRLPDGSPEASRFDITQVLLPANILLLRVTLETGAECHGEVFLELPALSV